MREVHKGINQIPVDGGSNCSPCPVRSGAEEMQESQLRYESATLHKYGYSAEILHDRKIGDRLKRSR